MIITLHPLHQFCQYISCHSFLKWNWSEKTNQMRRRKASHLTLFPENKRDTDTSDTILAIHRLPSFLPKRRGRCLKIAFSSSTTVTEILLKASIQNDFFDCLNLCERIKLGDVTKVAACGIMANSRLGRMGEIVLMRLLNFMRSAKVVLNWLSTKMTCNGEFLLLLLTEQEYLRKTAFTNCPFLQVHKSLALNLTQWSK